VQPSGADGQSAILEAARWLEQLLTGSVGTTVATIVIAIAGIVMMQGHLAPRRAVTVILGAFILFGAPAIAAGIVAAAKGQRARSDRAVSVTPPPALPGAAPQFDPYAGASTPR
jgi:type IV secretory pathway VirB2 component (pilin)